jgi:hypothetical protein
MSKYWCFTLNNYTPEEEKALISLGNDDTGCLSYLIYGREKGSNGTPHLQGYVEFRSRTRLASAKNKLGIQRIHLERRLGTAAQAAVYCKKDGDYFEVKYHYPVYGDLTYNEINTNIY